MPTPTDPRVARVWKLLPLLACLVFPFITATTAQAQSPEAQSPEAQVQRFFDTYAVQAEAAVDTFFTNNPYIESNREAVDGLTAQLGEVLGLVGPFRGYEVVAIRPLGERLVNYLVVVGHDRQPLRFSFTFYRPQETWQAQNFRYTDDFTGDFEQIGGYAP
ncbi:MAG: hypothetical protein AAF624_12390 [Bacteroidota bacterium]